MSEKNERQKRELDYLNREPIPYDKLCDNFPQIIDFSKETQLSTIEKELENLSDYRVWLLYASNDEKNWECLQVAHSKNGVKKEISDDIHFLFSGCILPRPAATGALSQRPPGPDSAAT